MNIKLFLALSLLLNISSVSLQSAQAQNHQSIRQLMYFAHTAALAVRPLSSANAHNQNPPLSRVHSQAKATPSYNHKGGRPQNKYTRVRTKE